MVNTIGDLIGPLHKVSLKQAEKVIVVEINQALAGISIVTGGKYNQFLAYNLRKFQEQVRNKDTETPAAVEVGTVKQDVTDDVIEAEVVKTSE